MKVLVKERFSADKQSMTQQIKHHATQSCRDQSLRQETKGAF